MKLTDRALILAKIEATYGTDPTPVAASDAILSSVPSFELVGSRKERNVALPYYGKLPPINVGEALKLSFSTELRGAGALPDTPPRIGALMRACNFTETIDNTPASESTTYDPNSTVEGESVTIYFYVDGVLHKALGCVGSFKVSAKVNEVPTIDFEFIGLYAGTHVSDVAFPTPTFGDAATPPIFHTAAFTFQTYSAIIEAINIDVGNSFGKRPDANDATGVTRHFISGREVKGDCDPEVPAISAFNPWDKFENSTEGALSVSIGTVTQNRCTITMPKITLDVPKHGERESLLTYALSFTSHPSLTAGNNEVSIKFD
ncbi:MAG: hypothetical protein KAR06_01835 [Deltaproteobacteria bacterium]|nr:hypothetical protein [Deltaproteobacteria bacterium]